MKFSQAQSEAYFELCKYRMKNVYLTWVEQFLDLIEEEIPQSKLSMFFEVMESINVVIDKYKTQNELK